MSRTIPIENLSGLFSYDPISGVLTRKGHRIRKPFGRTSSGGYLQHSACGKNFSAHRVAWALTYGEWPNQIDHINGDRQDNRICNLRSVTGAENSRNLRLRPCASGYKGVLLRYGTYSARITVGLQRHYLGVFDNPKDAAMAYDRAAIYFHGAFAATNFSLGLL